MVALIILLLILALLGGLGFAAHFLWFVLNPEFGWARFDAEHGSWHRHWVWGAPVDYWVGGAVAALIVLRRHWPR